MKIISYSDNYAESVKDLLVELQKYIVEIDREKYNILTDEFREKYFEKTIEQVNMYQGKIFLALEDEKVVGLIVGLINNEEESTYDFKAPKRGRISELVVAKECRFGGIGKKLLNEMENYFKEEGCKGVLLNVIAYNENAQKFYYKNRYFNRNIEVMKKI